MNLQFIFQCDKCKMQRTDVALSIPVHRLHCANSKWSFNNYVCRPFGHDVHDFLCLVSISRSRLCSTTNASLHRNRKMPGIVSEETIQKTNLISFWSESCIMLYLYRIILYIYMCVCVDSFCIACFQSDKLHDDVRCVRMSWRLLWSIDFSWRSSGSSYQSPEGFPSQRDLPGPWGLMLKEVLLFRINV